MWLIVFSYQITLKACNNIQTSTLRGIKEKREKKERKKLTSLRIEPRTPCKLKYIFLDLTVRPRRCYNLVAAHLKIYVFKYEQNNNRLLEIYKNKQADTH